MRASHFKGNVTSKRRWIWWLQRRKWQQLKNKVILNRSTSNILVNYNRTCVIIMNNNRGKMINRTEHKTKTQIKEIQREKKINEVILSDDVISSLFFILHQFLYLWMLNRVELLKRFHWLNCWSILFLKVTEKVLEHSDIKENARTRHRPKNNRQLKERRKHSY